MPLLLRKSEFQITDVNKYIQCLCWEMHVLGANNFVVSKKLLFPILSLGQLYFSESCDMYFTTRIKIIFSEIIPEHLSIHPPIYPSTSLNNRLILNGLLI